MGRIDVGQLREFCSQPLPPLLLDVREPWEAALASISVDNAPMLLMPMAQVPQRLFELDPAQPIVCYCHHGMRSQQVVAFLQRQGFESVYNLTGGIDAWSLLLEAENHASPVPRY